MSVERGVVPSAPAPKELPSSSVVRIVVCRLSIATNFAIASYFVYKAIGDNGGSRVLYALGAVGGFVSVGTMAKVRRSWFKQRSSCEFRCITLLKVFLTVIYVACGTEVLAAEENSSASMAEFVSLASVECLGFFIFHWASTCLEQDADDFWIFLCFRRSEV